MSIDNSAVPESSGAEGADGIVGEAEEGRQFVTFRVGEEIFAVPMAPVQEIIRMPEVVRVPLSPESLEGLANLRGRVLPIVRLGRMFHFPERDDDDATRVLVIHLGIPMGFVVDQVLRVISVEPGQIEASEAVEATVDSELLDGVIKDVGGYPMVMTLRFERLLENEFVNLARQAAARGGFQGARRSDADREGGDEEEEDRLQLVSFTVADQEYAIPIEEVQEIVQVPENIIHIPNAPPHVLGVINLRNRLLPLVGLRRIFSLPRETLDERNRIVVLTLGARGTRDDVLAVGMVTDTVSEVLRVERELAEAVPPLLARESGLDEITSICRLEGGKRLVSVISVERMFHHPALREATATAAELNGEEAMQAHEGESGDEGSEDEQQFVVFVLTGEEFGVPIASVNEIVRIPEELTRVPKAPPFVEGIINLRGAVLPVIDQRRRFGLDALERNDRQRIMVFTIRGMRTGFIVDAVSEVLRIPRQAIEAAPELSDAQAYLIRRIANLEHEQRMIQLLDVDALLDTEESRNLREIPTDEPARGPGEALAS
ncbi:chemotaxis protein CheW [Endothiovibrio diazotrophicus]